MPEDVARRRLRSVVEGKLLAGPETLQINLRNGCNLNCDFCWNHAPSARRPPAAWHREQLTDEHLGRILEALPALRPDRVLLSGRGEPLLHPRVEPLLEALRRLAIPVTIQTNGVAGPSPTRLIELGVDRLLVNVSAGTPEGYAAVHPGRGHLFDAVCERLDELRGTPPEVTLVAIVHEGNAGDVADVVRLAARVEADRVFLKGMEHRDDRSRHLLLSPRGRALISSGIEEARAIAATHGLTLDLAHLEQVAREQRPDRTFTPDAAEGACYMGWYYLRVACDGRVMFCCKDKPVGHLDERSLLRVWRSAAYQLWRVGGRDADESVGLFDAKCAACSNFATNRSVHDALLDLAAAAG